MGLEGVWEEEGPVFGLASLPSHKTKTQTFFFFFLISRRLREFNSSVSSIRKTILVAFLLATVNGIHWENFGKIYFTKTNIGKI